MSDMNDDELFMEELRQEFMESVSQNLKDLLSLVQDGKMEEIRRIAHDIKGMAGTFGMESGSDIAKDLQIAADNKEADKVKTLIDQLVSYMKENGVSI